jgi:hypothetical protein
MDGVVVGCTLGWLVGRFIGCLEGWLLGRTLGWLEGWLLGCFAPLVGALVGLMSRIRGTEGATA